MILTLLGYMEISLAHCNSVVYNIFTEKLKNYVLIYVYKSLKKILYIHNKAVFYKFHCINCFL
jgi:hypothetical protein